PPPSTTSLFPYTTLFRSAAARHSWPNQNPIGAYGRLSGPNGSRFQVVGVVGDVKNDGLGNPTVPEIYLLSVIAPVNPMLFVVRSDRKSTRLNSSHVKISY